MSRKYVLITPCRDEAAYIETTIDSIASQSIPPHQWIIVDDGSTDDTPQILKRAAQSHSFIKVIQKSNRGQRSVGPGVIEAFYEGLSHCDLDDCEYVCKLDGDLEIPPHYFETLIGHFESDPWLGTISGKLFLRYGDRLVEERCGDENSVGPAKFYRVQCFRDIGGFVREVSWDGIDGHMCRIKGWVARSVNQPELQLIHLRRMGSSQQSFWTGRLRWGRGKYFMGSAFYFIAAVAVYRMFERPYVLSGVGILVGYLKAMVTRHPRFENKRLRKFLRKFEWNSLIRGKGRTTNQYHNTIRETTPQPSQRNGDLTTGSAWSTRVLAVSSGGGHWTELMRIVPAFEGCDIAFVTVRREYEEEAKPHRLHVVNDATRWNKLAVVFLALRILWIILRERPDVVVTTGAAPGYFAIRIGKLFGARTIWLDSIANVNELSMSGRMVQHVADLCLTQWPHLASEDSDPTYFGAVV